MTKKKIIIITLSIIIFIITLAISSLIVGYKILDNQYVRLRLYDDVDINETYPKNYIWYTIVSDKSKSEIEKMFKINLPNVDYENECIYISIKRKIEKIRYSIIKEYLTNIGNKTKRKAYPGTVILSEEYEPNKIYIYIGDKYIPGTGKHTRCKIGEENCYKF